MVRPLMTCQSLRSPLCTVRGLLIIGRWGLRNLGCPGRVGVGRVRRTTVPILLTGRYRDCVALLGGMFPLRYLMTTPSMFLAISMFAFFVG